MRRIKEDRGLSAREARERDKRRLLLRKVSARARDMERSQNPWDYWFPRPERGKSCNVQGRVEIEARETIDSLCAHKDGPWDTPSDFVRCAVGWYLAVVGPLVKRDKFRAALQVMQLGAMAAREERRVVEVDAYLGKVLDTARALAKKGLHEEARRMVREVAEQEWDDPVADKLVGRWLKTAAVLRTGGAE